MARLKQQYINEGFYGIGIHHARHDVNIGTLWRSAYVLGAAFIFTVGRRVGPQLTDVTHAWTKIPLYHYTDIDDLKSHLPHAARLIAIEMGETSQPIEHYDHPRQAVYLLGNEGSGLPEPVIQRCHDIVRLPGAYSLNVATAGTIVLYDRVAKTERALPQRRDGRDRTSAE